MQLSVKLSKFEAKKKREREKKQKRKEKDKLAVSWLMEQVWSTKKKMTRREMHELYKKEGRDKKRVYD